MNRVSIRLVVMVGLLITGVGMLDALASSEFDLFVVFLLSGLTHLVILLQLRATRIPRPKPGVKV